jgi:hypothetical protein
MNWYRRGVGVGFEKRCHYFNRCTHFNGNDQGRTFPRIYSFCIVRGVKDDGQCSLPMSAEQWDDQVLWMPFSTQRLHVAAFNDLLIYRCLWIDYAVLRFAVFDWLHGDFGVLPLSSSTMQKYERGATHSLFSIEFSRTTVDVISILNVPPRHATKNNLQVKKSPTLTSHNSQYVEHQMGLRPFNSAADQIMSFILHIGIGRHWSLLVGADWLV